MNDYWKNILSRCYNNILPSTDASIYNIIIDKNDIGYTLKGKLSGSGCCAIDNKGGGGSNYWLEGAIAGAVVGAKYGSSVPIVGTIIGAIIGGIIGSLFGSFPKPSRDCATSVSFLGIQYYIKPYYNNIGKLVADYEFYF